MCDPSMAMGGEVVTSLGSFELDAGNPNARRQIHNGSGYELRASKMYTYCDCRKRNGLQDNCPRITYHGNSNGLNHTQGTGLQSFPQYDGIQMRGFESPNIGVNQKNDVFPFNTPPNGYPEYFGNTNGMHAYSMAQPNGMPDGSNWGGVQQGNHPYYN